MLKRFGGKGKEEDKKKKEEEKKAKKTKKTKSDKDDKKKKKKTKKDGAKKERKSTSKSSIESAESQSKIAEGSFAKPTVPSADKPALRGKGVVVGIVGKTAAASSKIVAAEPADPNAPEAILETIKSGDTLDGLTRLVAYFNDNPSDDKWANRLISAKGVAVLIGVLQEKNMKKRKNGLDISVQVETVKALENVVQVPRGLKELSTPDNLREIVMVFESEDVPLKSSLLHLLSVFCLLDPEKGTDLVLEAFNAYRRSAKERKRFQTLAESLQKVDNIDYLIHALELLNAVVNSPADIEKRVQLRAELEGLQFSQALNYLNNTYAADSEGLKTQIDVYNEEMEHDKSELPSADESSPESLFETIKKSLAGSPNLEALGSVLKTASELMTLPVGNDVWKGIENVVKAYESMIKKDGFEDSVTVISVTALDDMNEIHQSKVQSLNRQLQEVKEAIEAAEKEKSELSAKVKELETAKFKQALQEQMNPNEPAKPAEAKVEIIKVEVPVADAEMEAKLKKQEAEVAEALNKFAEADARAKAAEVRLHDLESRLKEAIINVDKKDEEIRQLSARGAPSPIAVDAPPAPPSPDAPAPPPAPPAPGGPSIALDAPPPPPAPDAPAPPPAPGAPPPPPAPGAPPPPPAPGAPPPPPGPPGPPPPPGPPGPPGPPPPPGAPPAPGAPPPPGGPAAPAGPMLKPKPVINPSIKMKQFNWSKIPDMKVTSSYWKDADEEGIELDKSELEAMFGAKVIEKKEAVPGSPHGEPGAAPEKKGPITVIDPKRANNGAIMLSRFKMSYPELKKAILDLDEAVISIEGAGALAEYVPTTEEVEQIANCPEEKTKLGKTEQFFWEVKDIHRLGTRLSCFKYKMAFDGQMADLKPDVDAVLLAIKEIKKSPKLKKLLEIILALGNYLNGGTFRGRAYGFKLDALNKLRDTKSADNQTTLLHYLVQVVMNKHPEILDFGREVKHVAPASRVVLSVLQSNVAALSSGFKQLENEIPLSKTDEGDRFVPVMTEFVEKRKPLLEELSAGVKALEEEFKTLAADFGENPDCTPDQFFGNLATFITSFETANKDIVRKREKEAKDKERKANPGVSPRAKPGPGGAPGGAAAPAMGDVMSQMKTGSFFRMRREQQAKGGPAPAAGAPGRGGLAPGRGGPAGAGGPGRGGFALPGGRGRGGPGGPGGGPKVAPPSVTVTPGSPREEGATTAEEPTTPTATSEAPEETPREEKGDGEGSSDSESSSSDSEDGSTEESSSSESEEEGEEKKEGDD